MLHSYSGCYSVMHSTPLFVSQQWMLQCDAFYTFVCLTAVDATVWCILHLCLTAVDATVWCILHLCLSHSSGCYSVMHSTPLFVSQQWMLQCDAFYTFVCLTAVDATVWCILHLCLTAVDATVWCILHLCLSHTHSSGCYSVMHSTPLFVSQQWMLQCDAFYTFVSQQWMLQCDAFYTFVCLTAVDATVWCILHLCLSHSSGCYSVMHSTPLFVSQQWMLQCDAFYTFVCLTAVDATVWCILLLCLSHSSGCYSVMHSTPLFVSQQWMLHGSSAVVWYVQCNTFFTFACLPAVDATWEFSCSVICSV